MPSESSYPSRRRSGRRRRRKSSGERAVLALIIVLILGLCVFGAIRSFVKAPELPDGEDENAISTGDTGTQTDDENEGDPSARQRKEHYYTILLSGVDDHNGGSDTNILLSVDAENGVLNAVSVPRDTLIDVDWNVKKFNASYNVGGIDRMKTELTKLLGIPVDFYVSVDLDGFVELVNAIGGVDFDVPVNMNYDDPVQNLHIHINKGMQHLDGKDAVKVVRWRQNNDGSGYPNGDLGRIETQQAFLTAVAQQMLNNLGKNPIDAITNYVNIFYEYVETDLEVGNLIWIGEQAMNAGMENIHFHTLPGDGAYVHGGSYYVLNPEETLTLINESFNPFTTPITAEEMDIPTK